MNLARVRRHLSYSNVISTICLFILLGGGAYAATKLPKNSVGSKQLKKNAVTGVKVADGSLSSADIKGPVASASNAAEAAHAAEATHAARADAATSADHAVSADRAASADQATNAGQLGGAPASSFFSSAKVKRVDQEVEVSTGSHDFSLLTMGPLTLTMACNKGANLTIGITAESSAPGATVYAGFANSVPQSSGQIFPMSGGEASFLTRTDSATGEAGSGQLVYRDDNTSIVMPFGYFVSELFSECRFSGVALQS